MIKILQHIEKYTSVSCFAFWGGTWPQSTSKLSTIYAKQNIGLLNSQSNELKTVFHLRFHHSINICKSNSSLVGSVEECNYKNRSLWAVSRPCYRVMYAVSVATSASRHSHFRFIKLPRKIECIKAGLTAGMSIVAFFCAKFLITHQLFLCKKKCYLLTLLLQE